MNLEELTTNFFRDDFSEKRNSVRYNILNAYLLVQNPKSLKRDKFDLEDISAGGFSIKIEDHEKFFLFPKQTLLEGTLVLPNATHYINFETKRRNPSQMTAGFAFKKLTKQAKEAILNSFDVVSLAHGMKLIKTANPNESWLHGDKGSDFIFHFKNKALVGFTMILQKDFVSWSEGKGLNTGKINFNYNPKNISEDLLRKKLTHLNPDEGVSIKKISRLKNFIRNNNAMQDKLKSWVIGHLDGIN